MVARLDGQAQARKQAQDRFHPPAIFEHDIAHGNAAKSKPQPSPPSQDSSPPSSGYSAPVFPGSYDYSPPSFIDAKPMSMDSYSPPDTAPKV